LKGKGEEEMIELIKINPHPDETYYVGEDDGCLVVTTREDGANKVWLSLSMVRWISKNGLSVIEGTLKEKIK
jgi:hypothetical protein